MTHILSSSSWLLLAAWQNKLLIGVIAIVLILLGSARPFFDLVIRRRRINRWLKLANQHQLNLTREQIDAHDICGGRVEAVIQAMVDASKHEIPLEWNTACAIDLAGRDVIEAVRRSTVVETYTLPADPDSQAINAVAQDGIELCMRLEVKVRFQVSKAIGGATHETILARVGEALVNKVGSCQTHQEAINKQGKWCLELLQMGADAGTAYELLVVHITEMKIGRNIGEILTKAQQAGHDIVESDINIDELADEFS